MLPDIFQSIKYYMLLTINYLFFDSQVLFPIISMIDEPCLISNEFGINVIFLGFKIEETIVLFEGLPQFLNVWFYFLS